LRQRVLQRYRDHQLLLIQRDGFQMRMLAQDRDARQAEVGTAFFDVQRIFLATKQFRAVPRSGL